MAIWPPSYIARLRTADTGAIRREAEAILERVKADYGDVKYLNGMVLTDETLATVADRELADVRTLAVGQIAPEIAGEDVDGKPMKLSEFRGKVVVLDFGSHTHCGACRLAYPRLRDLVDRYRNRPFVVLGINNNDSRETLKELETNKEITWRCWWDHAQDDGPGPITTRWNVRGYPTFIVLDQRWDDPLQGPQPDRRKGFRRGDRGPGEAGRGRAPRLDDPDANASGGRGSVRAGTKKGLERSLALLNSRPPILRPSPEISPPTFPHL